MFMIECRRVFVQGIVMFVINYHPDITTENVILYKGVQYNIVRVDVFEGYKSDLTLYCKRQA